MKNVSRCALTKVLMCITLAGALVISLFGGIGTVWAYTSHAPIRIASNSDFTYANGVTGGSGTQGSPYVISGWEISGVLQTYTYAIYISDTTAYFIIEDCYLHDIGSGDAIGILLEDVTNGVIKNNIIEDCDGYGAYLDDDTWSNWVYLNDFLGNNGVPGSGDSQGYDDDTSELTPNYWHYDEDTGGNHWSEHHCTGDPSDGSEPYDIDGAASSQDTYPYENTIN